MVEEEQNEDETNRQEVMAMRRGRGGTDAKEWRERQGEPDRKQREERQMIGTRNLK